MLLLFLLLGLIAVVSIVVASLPLRSAWLRFPLLTIHVVVSVAALVELNGPWPLEAAVLGPGLLVALARLILMAYHGVLTAIKRG